MRRRVLVLATLLAACAATPLPPVETDYFREQLALARRAPSAEPRAEGALLRESAAGLSSRAAAETERARRGDDTEGLVDLDLPGAREFVAKASDPAQVEAVLGGAPLDFEQVLLAVHARNPDVAAARRRWTAAARMYEQATYLEDLLLRYSAFTRLATPGVGAAPMREAAFPYPGVVALKGEMIDREVAIARETARMRLRDAVVTAAKAYHAIAHHDEELRIRDEQVAVEERGVAAAKARVSSGMAAQAELLEMETALARARNDRAHALASLARARAELNTLIDRAPDAPLAVVAHGDPPSATPDRAPLLELARRLSPEVRIAAAETARADIAIRMAEAMLFAAPAPGAVAARGAMPVEGAAMPSDDPSRGDEASKGGDAAMAGHAGRGAAPAAAPALPPRAAPPSGSPGAFGPDVAWVAELRERRAALGRAGAEAGRAVERRVIEAHYEIDAMRRMFEVAARTAEPLAAQAVEERLRLYEAGRGTLDDLLAALRRRLTASHDAAQARHDFRDAEAALWWAVGGRPGVARHEMEGGR